MFTGIVTSMGVVKKARERGGILDLEIEAPRLARDIEVGGSVSVNGVCLTATRTTRKSFSTQAMDETLSVTTIASLKKGSIVNLEPAARFSDRIGGHMVQGHIDQTAPVVRIEDLEGARRIWFEPPEAVIRFLVPKGSIAIDGVSLTIVEVGRTSFQVALIPHTLEVTTLKDLSVGSVVNLEVDVMAKYVEKFVDAFNERDSADRTDSNQRERH
ncbi:MAG: riboflavin synthase [Actinomycetota bacterium]